MLIIAISSRALFNFEVENQLFESSHRLDHEPYRQFQLEHINEPASEGVAFTLIKKLLDLNTPEHPKRCEVVIVSRNDPVSGLRVLNSAKRLGLPISRAIFTKGRPPYEYLRPLNATLFLSANAQDVRLALQSGFPAAQVYFKTQTVSVSSPNHQAPHVKQDEKHEIRIAFDGDAVLFSDEAERVFQEQGLPAFEAHEVEKARLPLPAGPFKPLLTALHQLQNTPDLPIKLRTALVTARSSPAHERAIRTLMSWNITVDEALFLGGLDKAPFLSVFEPDFFFDDQDKHCQLASQVVPTGHVLSGIKNN